MPLKQNKVKLLIFRDFIFLILFIGIALDLVFLYFFLFNSPERKGIYFLMRKQPTEAIQQFEKALKEKPSSPFLHLNIGLSYDLQNQPLKAIEKYKWVTKMFGAFPQFVSYFNQGELRGRLNQPDEALDNYQSALNFNTETKKIKQNIELLFKQNKGKNKNKKDQKEPSKQKQDQPEQQNSTKKEKSEQQKHQNKAQPDPSQLTEEQKKAILKEIEKQESKVRAKQFRKKHRSRGSRNKDW